MNFVSYAFFALFAFVLASRLLFGRRKTEPGYVAVLLGSSLVFYAWHVPAYLGILLLSAGVDYAAALWLQRATAEGRSASTRRAILLVSLSVNLGLLGYFKYAGFLSSTAASLAEATGLSLGRREIDVMLPMGISFYTFQSMSYTIDVYRGTLEPIRSFSRFMLFIVFFPQLVAGPIVRASEFLPQMPRVRRLHAGVVAEGAFLLVSGYFLKVVCADNLGVLVDEHWDAGYQEGASSVLLLALALMFAGQIFCDFAGYSQIARGLAYLLGFRLPVNFDAPYLAGSFKNFWERWHITLSRWLRDYLYVPLGGNRVSPARTYVNLLVVMLLGGLWHGAAWTYVLWGGLHGAALALERALGLHRGGGERPWWMRLSWFVVVQAIVLVTWIVFRSRSVAGAWQFVENLASFRAGRLPLELAVGLLFLLPILVLHVWTALVERRAVRALGWVGRSVLAGLMIAGILTLYGSTAEFIYFQF